MRIVLIVFFLLILAGMLWVTITASLDRSVFEAGAEIWNDPWSRATLFDAYFGFLVVYVWIFFRETRPSIRILWFILLMTLGNIAIAVYFLMVLMGRSGRDWRILFPLREDLSP